MLLVGLGLSALRCLRIGEHQARVSYRVRTGAARRNRSLILDSRPLYLDERHLLKFGC